MATSPGFSVRPNVDLLVLIPGTEVQAQSPPTPPTTLFLLDSNIRICAGASMLGSPVAPASIDEPGFCATDIAIDWLDRIHVLARRYDFGNILGTIDNVLTIFSSFSSQDVSWTSFVNNSGTGLDITDLPTLPDTLTPFDGRTLNLRVTTNGVPQFDSTMDFVFDVGTTSVPITGSRIIVFPYVPESPIRETLEFLTEVIESKDGSEQRVALRKNPRQTFKLKFIREEGTERSRIDFLMVDWQHRIFGLPMHHEPSLLTQATAVNDTVLNVDSSAYADLRVGGLLVVLQDDVTFDAVEIVSLTSTTITVNSPIQNVYPIGTSVFPVRTAIAAQTVSGGRSPVGAATFGITFKILDNDSDLADTSAFNTFEGKVLLDDANYMNRELRESYQKKMISFDGQTGVFSQDSPWSTNRHGSSKTFRTSSRQALWETRQLFHALRGRQVSLWIPTFFKEIVPTATLASGGATMTITNVGYSRFVQNRASREKFRVVLNDGTFLERTVSSSSEIDKDFEQITFSVSWPSTILVSEIKRVELFEKVRVDSDSIPIVHDTAKGDASITFPTKVVFE